MLTQTFTESDNKTFARAEHHVANALMMANMTLNTARRNELGTLRRAGTTFTCATNALKEIAKLPEGAWPVERTLEFTGKVIADLQESTKTYSRHRPENLDAFINKIKQALTEHLEQIETPQQAPATQKTQERILAVE